MLLYRAYGFILSCNKSGSNGLKYYKYYSYIKQPPTCLDGFCLMSHSSTLDYDTWVNKSQNKATISIMTCLESNAELLWRVILLLQGLCQGFIGTSLFWIVNLEEKCLTKDQLSTDNTEHTRVSVGARSRWRLAVWYDRVLLLIGLEDTGGREPDIRDGAHNENHSLSAWAGKTSLRTESEWKTLHVSKSGCSIKDLLFLL